MALNDNYIVFSVADTAYALPSQQVAHLEMVEHVTPVPNATAIVDGVVFSRGEVVPALNLRARFGFPRIAYDLRTRLLVVRHDERTAGLVVDAAREFIVIPAAAIHPPNEGLRGMSGRYLSGIATIGERMILILDLSEVLNLGEPLLDIANETAAGSANRSM
jgi:purine-binding chemotaxis protein CheW